MTQIGKVKTIKNKKAIISVVRKGACGDNCGMCGACQGDALEIVAWCDLEVNPGSFVEISSEGNVIVLGMVCLFILPIILPLLSFIVVDGWLGNIAAYIVAGIVLLLCLTLIYLLSKSQSYLKKAQPKVIRVVRE